LFAAFLALIFVAVTILGIILIVIANYYETLGVGLIIFGAIGVVVAFTGCCGAGFEKDNSESSGVKIKGFFLVLFFAVMVILLVVLIIFGAACISLRNTVYIVYGTTKDFNVAEFVMEIFLKLDLVCI
jgi:hypothetical protein